VNWRGEPVTAKLLNQVAECEARNQKIIRTLYDYIVDPNRYILLISDRISQLEWFYNEMQRTHSNCRIGYYIGGMKQSVLDENAANCKVLLATYQMTAEGFSVKKLNTIVLCTPRKKVEQSTGRILRITADKRVVEPLIVDIIDQHDTYVRQWYLRARYYRKCAYDIRHIGKERKETKEKNVIITEECMIKL
jgi:hypothetical protein